LVRTKYSQKKPHVVGQKNKKTKWRTGQKKGQNGGHSQKR